MMGSIFRFRRNRELERQRLERRLNDPYTLLAVYQNNPRLWIAMEAAILQVSPSMVEAKYMGEKLRHLRHHARAIRALAVALKEVREDARNLALHSTHEPEIL